MAGSGGHDRRASVPIHQPSRVRAARLFVRYRRSARGEEAGGPGRAGRQQVRGPFPPGGARYKCGDRGSVEAVDHETDRASLGSDSSPIQPGRQPVLGEQRTEARPVAKHRQFCSQLRGAQRGANLGGAARFRAGDFGGA